MVLPSKPGPFCNRLCSKNRNKAPIDNTACNKRLEGKRQLEAKNAAGKRETVQAFGLGGIRQIIVPKKERNLYPAVLYKSEFTRIKTEARIVTQKEKQEMLDAIDRKTEKKLRESKERREKIQQWEQQREMGKKLNDLEIEARQRANHLLCRAYELRQENEDEVQMANRLILSTKCHAIRDAQVKEKKLMRDEMEKEETRLDQMMEQERQRSLKLEAEQREREAERTRQYVAQIRSQINEKEQERKLDEQQRAEESRLINEAQMVLQLEELEALRKKTVEQQVTRMKLAEVNKQLQYCKDEEKEESRVADLKIKEYLRKKEKREAAWEEEQRLIRQAKQRQIARLQALQEQQQGMEAQLDELNAQRAQEEVEREWRRKELEEARKKARENEELKKARAEQILDRKRSLALEIAREKREFERILRVQMKGIEKDDQEEMNRKDEAMKHRYAIIKQIQEKELERIRQRQELFKEISNVKAEQESRERSIRETMKKKVRDLRNSKLPEVYVKEVERKLKLDKE